MFNAVMKEAVTFRKIVESIKEIVVQVNLEITQSGISIQAMDSAHVSLVSLMLNEGGFESFKCEGEEVRLGINLNEFGKILKMASDDDELTLSTDEKASFLNIGLKNNKTYKDSEFQLNLLNLETEGLGIPDTEYPSSFTISSTRFFKTCKEITTMAEILNIQLEDEKKVTFHYSGKSGNGKISYKANESNNDDRVILKCDESVNTRYGLQYLNIFSKASTLASTVTVSLSNSFPMLIFYDLEELGFIKFYLAPKMEEDDS